MTPFETTLGFILLAVAGLLFLVALGWFIVTAARLEHQEDAERRRAHGR